MSSAVDIQIVSAPNLEKIENFFKDVSYRETIEFSANFNSHLCNERRLRLPFFDSQTGVAQNSSQLFLNKRQRMPGFRQGQIYTYPAARWRKSRRQYLNRLYRFPDRPFQALRREHEALLAGGNVATSFSGTSIGTSISSVLVSSGAVGVGSGITYDADFNGSVLLEESSSLGAAGGDTSDSKDSQHQHLKEELPKEWFYEEMDVNDADSLEEQKSPADDEYDYDPRYGSKKRRKKRASKKATLTPGECPSGNSRRRIVSGRGRSLSSADTISTLDSFESFSGDVAATPTSSVRRSRTGTGTRGRRRVKVSSANSCDPPSPVRISEPPSFESAAAAVGNMDDLSIVVEHGELRNYRKYL